MKFLSNLPKLFINSAVRQVGRDGGKVVSNKIYKGKHGTPVYHSGNPYSSESAHHTKSRPRTNNSSYSSSRKHQSEPIKISEIDMSIQPLVKEGGLKVVLKGLLIQIIPIIGSIAVFVKGLSYLNTKTTPIYTKVPNRVPDKRYKEGYRVEGVSYVQTQQMRYLNNFERKSIKNRGFSYLLSIVIFFLIALAIRFVS